MDKYIYVLSILISLLYIPPLLLLSAFTAGGVNNTNDLLLALLIIVFPFIGIWALFNAIFQLKKLQQNISVKNYIIVFGLLCGVFGTLGFIGLTLHSAHYKLFNIPFWLGVVAIILPLFLDYVAIKLSIKILHIDKDK